ncbi:DUF4377 domain-containing protein [Chryseobacterium sp.]|uniref:DUF4377 domain-containing protein n=1 Tax=Chryseobacterium sp. TaxID=1871047 RepID=UPI0023F2CA2C|nr:DUF4377 domain-containing protein [Chryseobacterium sp.]
MNYKSLITTCILSLTLLACNATQKFKEKTILIGAETKPCDAGAGMTRCMQVKWSEDQKYWGYFYDHIEGFNYQEGYEYELVIKEEKVEDPQADASSVKITLVKELSKKKMLPTLSNNQLSKKPFTSSHLFTARYNGTDFHQCMGRTALCPDRCGESGNLAKFSIIDYKNHLINGKAGTEKLKEYAVLISDYYKKDLNKPYVAAIKSLNKGDIVTINLDFVYDTTQPVVKTEQKIISITKNSGQNSNTGQLPNNETITDKRWTLVEFMGKTVMADGKDYYIIFHTKDKRVETKAGCNLMRSTYEMENIYALKINALASTRMACKNGQINEIEYSKQIQNVNNFTVSADGKRLSLNKNRMSPIAVFQLGK